MWRLRNHQYPKACNIFSVESIAPGFLVRTWMVYRTHHFWFCCHSCIQLIFSSWMVYILFLATNLYTDWWLKFQSLWKIWKSVGMIIPNIWKHNPNVPNHQPDISKVESPAKVFQNLLGQHSSWSSENMGAAGPIILNRCFRISLSNTSAFQWVVSTNRPRETLFVCSVFVCYIYIYHHPASEIHIFINQIISGPSSISGEWSSSGLDYSFRFSGERERDAAMPSFFQ